MAQVAVFDKMEDAPDWIVECINDYNSDIVDPLYIIEPNYIIVPLGNTIEAQVLAERIAETITAAEGKTELTLPNDQTFWVTHD